MAYIIKQINSILNDVIEDLTGQSGSQQTISTTDIVSMGKSIADLNLTEGFFGSLVNRLAKTVYFVRVYDGKDTRGILRDEHEYGAFIQKVYYKMPDFVENPEYKIPQAPVAPATEYTYKQSSPYDVQTTIQVSAAIFGGQGTLALEFVRPVDVPPSFQNLK